MPAAAVSRPAPAPLAPYLGSAYYPEAWPAEQIDEDIDLMRQAGMKVARIAEFAWSKMEPREGEYDFAWLHRVVEKLGQAGIATVMCTPTATPPIWLTAAHPEVLYVMDFGLPMPHGGRRHYCPNNPLYRDYTRKIVTRLAEEFGKDDRIIGWQIDNEVDYYRRPCICPVCVEQFRQRMQKKFRTIDALNKAWVLALWSQEYQSFDQLPTPRPDVWHHNSLRLAWSEFGSDSYADYVGFQAKILHKHTKHPIGTDMMPNYRIDYHDIHRELDLVQHNHYHGQGNLWEAAFWFDFCRSFKAKPFWNTETATCWNGGTAAGGYKDPGFCRANSWLPIALGGEANMYWLWRQHLGGQELMHGAVIDSHGRSMHIFDEVKEIAAGFESAGNFLRNTRPTPSPLALHFSNKTGAFFEHQPLVSGLKIPDYLLERFYRPLMQAQLRTEVIHPAHDLKDIRVLCSPMLPMLDEERLRNRLPAWIEAGGTWIAGPFTDLRTLDGIKFPQAPFGSLEEWAGLRQRYSIPIDEGKFSIRLSDGTVLPAAFNGDGFELSGGEALATYVDGPLAGLAAIVRRRIGKGSIIVLGTMLPASAYAKLVSQVAADAGIAPSPLRVKMCLWSRERVRHLPA